MKYPRIPTFTLEGIDGKIQTLQTVIGDNLSWIQHSFGKAERHAKLIDGKKEAYPVVFVDNKTDPVDVRPNDNFTALSFWDVIDPGRILYPGEEYSVVKYAFWEYDVALIIWANLNRIDDSVYNETKSQMRQDVINVLETKLISEDVEFQAGEIYDKSVTQVFEGYDLDNEETTMKWPFVAFRINGVVRFKRACPVSNSYSVTTTN